MGIILKTIGIAAIFGTLVSCSQLQSESTNIQLISGSQMPGCSEFTIGDFADHMSDSSFTENIDKSGYHHVHLKGGDSENGTSVNFNFKVLGDTEFELIEINTTDSRLMLANSLFGRTNTTGFIVSLVCQKMKSL